MQTQGEKMSIRAKYFKIFCQGLRLKTPLPCPHPEALKAEEEFHEYKCKAQTDLCKGQLCSKSVQTGDFTLKYHNEDKTENLFLCK